MRRSISGNGFIYGRHLGDTENPDRLAGVFLAMGGVSEHEWGIHNLLNAYGVASYIHNGEPCTPRFRNRYNTMFVLNEEFKPVFGFEGRKIHKLPHEFSIETFIDKKKKLYYMCGTSYKENYYKQEPPQELRFLHDFFKNRETKQEQKIVTAWSDSDFGIMVTKTELNNLKGILEAFNRLDIAMCYCIDTFEGLGDKHYEKEGLALLIYSAIPKEMKEKQYKIDEYNYNVFKQFEKTEIRQYLLEHNIKISELYPAWADKKQTQLLCFSDIENLPRKWYTIEQLREFADTGKVPIKILDKYR